MTREGRPAQDGVALHLLRGGGREDASVPRTQACNAQMGSISVTWTMPL